MQHHRPTKVAGSSAPAAAKILAALLVVSCLDFEVARAQVGLRGEVALWGGVLGNLRKCNFTVERSRVDENVWFNTATNGEFEGRKLLEPTHIRTRSESSNFHKTVRRAAW